MQDKRPLFNANSLAGRMKQYDSYRHAPHSMRSKQNELENIRRVHTASLTNSVVSSQKAVLHRQKSSSVHKGLPRGSRHETLPQRQRATVMAQPGAQKVALYAVAHAEATRDDVLADQFVGVDLQTVSKRVMSRAQRIFYGAGILIFVFATVASAQTIFVNHEAKEQLQVLGAQTQKPDEYGVAQGTGSEPAEAEVPKSAITAYRVDPELPRLLRIPDLGVFARIKHTGIDKNGAIDSPANINDVSWYRDSARPGNANGSSLLLGHVSGWTAPGIFKKLNQLKPGMRFEVEKGSGEKLTYEVTRTENIPLDQVDMAKILASDIPGQHDLKLMTCSGRYNKEKDIYEDRYVVYAKILR